MPTATNPIRPVGPPAVTPVSQPAQTQAPPTSLAGVPDWVAGLIGYGVLLLLAETTLGGLAVIFAWGIALTEVLSLAGNKQSPLLGLFQK